MKILVTGGAGFIGSHTCVELLEAGHDVVILDDLSNASGTVIDKIETITGKRPAFYQADAKDRAVLQEIFTAHAALCGAPRETLEGLMAAISVDACVELLDEVNLRQPVLSRIGRKMETRIALRMKGQARVEFIMFTGKYGVLGDYMPPGFVRQQLFPFTWKG